MGSDPNRENWQVSSLGSDPIGIVCCTLLLLAGCSTPPERYAAPPQQAIPSLSGSYHRVQRGETLWRIARSYGLDVKTLAGANRLPSASHLRVGQQLFIPLPAESSQFLWPVRGSLRTASGVHGIDISAPAGSLVRASRSGRVAVAAQRLDGWGKTVIVEHRDGYLSVYSGLDQILVAPGIDIRQGIPIGTLGARALHFEIRYGTVPRNTLALLPNE